MTDNDQVRLWILREISYGRRVPMPVHNHLVADLLQARMVERSYGALHLTHEGVRVLSESGERYGSER